MALLAQLEAKMNELMLRYRDLQEENHQLKSEILNLKTMNLTLEETNRVIEAQTDNLELVKKIAMNTGDSTQTKKELDRIVEEISECIHILEAADPKAQV